MNELTKQKIAASVSASLMRITRAMVSAGVPPLEAVELLEKQVADVRKSIEEAMAEGRTP